MCTCFEDDRETEFLRSLLDPLQFVQSLISLDVPGIQRARGLEHEEMCLLVRHRLVLHTARYDEALALR